MPSYLDNNQKIDNMLILLKYCQMLQKLNTPKGRFNLKTNAPEALKNLEMPIFKNIIYNQNETKM